MSIRKTLGMVVASGIVALAGVARGDEQEVPVKDLPKAVVDAVKGKFPGAAIQEAEKEEEDGKTVYEVELSHNGRKTEVSLKPDGTIVEVETVIGEKELPKAVSATLGAKYPGATFRKAESVTKGKDVSYEVVLVAADKKTWEIALDGQGKLLQAKEKKNGEDD